MDLLLTFVTKYYSVLFVVSVSVSLGFLLVVRGLRETRMLGGKPTEFDFPLGMIGIVSGMILLGSTFQVQQSKHKPKISKISVTPISYESTSATTTQIKPLISELIETKKKIRPATLRSGTILLRKQWAQTKKEHASEVRSLLNSRELRDPFQDMNRLFKPYRHPTSKPVKQ